MGGVVAGAFIVPFSLVRWTSVRPWSGWRLVLAFVALWLTIAAGDVVVALGPDDHLLSPAGFAKWLSTAINWGAVVLLCYPLFRVGAFLGARRRDASAA